MERQRFAGQIAGVGTTSGVRVVVGRWAATPLGDFVDAMIETATGFRVLVAPHEDAAAFIAATYDFDTVRIEDVSLIATPEEWSLRCTSLELDFAIGKRTLSGELLHRVPTALAESPAWCAVTDPVARVVMRGVRTRGVAKAGRREFYGATDSRRVTACKGSFEGVPLGRLADVAPPCHFGFSSTPRKPCVTDVLTTVQLDDP